MKKQIHLFIVILLLSLTSRAQYNLTITYTANQGATTLQGAAKVYFHSGASDVAGLYDTTAWHYVVGHWGMDDGLGEMTSLGFDNWTITFDPLTYYSQATNGPVTGTSLQRIGFFFRDANAANTGFDANGGTIYMNLNAAFPEIFNADGTSFFGVSAGTTAGISDLNLAANTIQAFPNPMTTSTVFRYNLSENKNAVLSVFDATGRLVSTLFNEIQTSGNHYFNWIGNDDNGNALSGGVYYYSLLSGSEKVNGKLIIVR